MSDEYGVVGHPVQHSRSPFIHALFARQTAQDLVYRPYDVPPDELALRLTEFFTRGGRGLNVTLPHKPAAAVFATRLTARAALAEAANTLSLESDGAVLGDNTDGAGLVLDLTENHHVELTGKRLLILGAGGATRGVVGPLLELAPAQLVVANRQAERATVLAERFAAFGPMVGTGFDALDGEPFDVVINATSASLAGERPAVTAAIIGSQTFCYDMAYGREATPFLRWARAEGSSRAALGWGMLVEQAAESFLIWRGIRPDVRPVLAALRAS